MVFVSKTIILAKVTDPLLSIQSFISANDLRDSGVIHSEITDGLPVLLVFKTIDTVQVYTLV